MFLNSEEEIKNWFKSNTHLSKDKLDNLIFKQKDNYIEINSDSHIALKFKILAEIKELPIKFGTINGNFYIGNSDLESFKGLPNIVNGNLTITNSNFKGNLKWDVEEINGDINLCGPNCKLDNIKFLENTKFKIIFLKVFDSIFENNNKLEEFKDFIIDIKYKSKIIEYESFINYLNSIKKEDNDLDNYLDYFDNQINIINNK